MSQMTEEAGEHGRLVRGMLAMGLPVDEDALQQLIEYSALLRKWNKTYNLVSSSDLKNFETRHLLDSMSISSHIQAGTLLDAGTGAGLPGLPLAIVNPDLDCTLLDSAGKKIRFLRQVKRSLGLDNVHPINMRVEDFQSEEGFNSITCRAFCSLAEFAASVRHLAGSNTRLLAMKGKYPHDELGALPAWLKLKRVEPITVPDLHAERHLVIMSVSR